jgi:demethylmenaquinone methyltransferase/2-methoxy-6-polyprenyl-1,4-benzoquinol methylase
MLHSFYKAGKKKNTSRNQTHSRDAMQGRDEYKNIASLYDTLLSPVMRSIRSTISTVVKHCGATNVIDLCCGTGEQLRMLCHDDILLTGVDLSGAMLNQARSTSPESIHYLECDASETPLPSSEYDAVIISFALHEKPAILHEKIFQEACRLVKHQGHIIIADYVTPPEGISAYIVGQILIPIIERAAGLDHYHNYRDWIEGGALEGFLHRHNPGKLTLVTPHSKGCSSVYVISNVKEDPLSQGLKRIQQHYAEQGTQEIRQ